MFMRQIKKNFNIFIAGMVLNGIFGNNLAFAEENDEEYENIENPYAYNQITINDDSVTFNGVTANSVTINGRNYTYTGDYSGSVNFNSGDANVAYNTITINGGNFDFDINDSDYFGNFNENIFSINGGSLALKISETDYSGNISNNNFSITGGTFKNIYNSLNSATVTGNTFNISGTPNISDAYIYAGFFGDAENFSENILNINSSDLTAKNIYNFDTINFTVPSDVLNGGVILTLTDGSTDLSGATINTYLEGGTSLNPGDKINLISSSGLTANASNITVDEGNTIHYENSTMNGKNYGLVAAGRI